MPAYDWSCHICKEPNRASSDCCAACGFPAAASGTEIEVALSQREHPKPRSVGGVVDCNCRVGSYFSDKMVRRDYLAYLSTVSFVVGMLFTWGSGTVYKLVGYDALEIPVMGAFAVGALAGLILIAAQSDKGNQKPIGIVLIVLNGLMLVGVVAVFVLFKFGTK